jgi:tetratricopeptide (TPR) repeat protein
VPPSPEQLAAPAPPAEPATKPSALPPTAAAAAAAPPKPPSPADAELTAADAALERDQLDEAGRHFQRALALAPSDPAARLGALRLRFAKLGLPLAYAEAPQQPELQKLVREAEAISAEHPDFAPALLEQGQWLIVLGEAPRASTPATPRSPPRSAPRTSPRATLRARSNSSSVRCSSARTSRSAGPTTALR